MTRLVTATLVLALALTVGLSAQAKKFGKALTLKETTKVSAIMANPDSFKGKRVQVVGPIVDVCEEMGCWIALGSDKEFETLRFKVEDGVIVFPMSIKGQTATVEGIIEVTMMSVEDQMKAGAEMAKEKKMAFDPKTIKGPKLNVQIKGEAAEVK